MRISDWSSDVCSSDLEGKARQVSGISGQRIAEPAPDDAIMLHYRVASRSIGIGALCPDMPFIGVKFRCNRLTVLTPNEIRMGVDRAPNGFLAHMRGMGEREPGIAHDDVMRNPVIDCIKRNARRTAGTDRQSKRLNSSHSCAARMPSSA